MKLRILTFNAWAMMPPLGRDITARMQAIGAALPGLELDIAAFQEFWDADARSQVVAAGRRAGLPHAWHRPAAASGSGLLVLARRPFRITRFEAYELRGLPEAIQHADYWGGKGFAELTFETNAGGFCLLDTHLHAAYAARALDPYVGHRVGQVLQLAERVRAIELPVIAAGDFNFEEQREEHEILTGLTGLEDVAAVLGTRENTLLSSNLYRDAANSEARIDYIFCRDGKRARITPTRIDRVLDDAIEGHESSTSYSDHAGLLAELELQAAVGAPPAIDPTALQLARRLLARGRADAERRRVDQRTAGALGLAAAPAALACARISAVTRRRFLQKSLLAAGSLAALVGAGSLIRSEALRAEELRAFDGALERANRLDSKAMP